MPNDPACGIDPAMPSETVYEHLLRITHLTVAASMLTDNFPPLGERGAPPIMHLLDMACAELDALAKRVSD
ncbi:hypothetical protein [Maliponia aquimaris]|uniref:Uncharacterized protein n=1 Tax=Maliponia aquimaris TaxID=1673631 RepID=A0A238KIB9_9RHOB|nr:hypothetical protein [Maliponia aquimaris]SMX42551.1 hypothetical protein MAA8898_02645 [Maliponia aquimaris]